MAIFNPGINVHGVAVTPQRAVSDFGESDWTDLPEIEDVVFVLDAPVAVTTESGARYTQDGSVFVPRGSDLRHGDRIPYQGTVYSVVGNVRWDMDHPLTRADFGYVEYAIRRGG